MARECEKSKLRKICFFNSHQEWGGGEKWHFDMASRLAAKNYSVVVAANHNSRLADKVRGAQLPLYEISIKNFSFLNIIKIINLALWMNRESFDCIIMNLPSDLKAAGLAARLAGIRRIVYRRGSAIPVRNTFFNRFLFRKVLTAVIANSNETKRTLLAHSPNMLENVRVQVIYNGIDLAQYDSSVDGSNLSREQSTIVLGHAGRLSSQKNQKFLIDAVSQLKKQDTNCHLKIAGSGPLEDELRAYADAKGVAEQIEFLGFQDNIRAFMAGIDIFLLSSHWEGFGYVLVEAMAAGRPVVAFNSSSNPEIVIDGLTGYLVDNKSLEHFVAKIIDLADDPAKRYLFGKAGRKRVEQVFTEARCTENLITFLEQLN
ncbi:glycosyltransferase [Pelovirga terrestris]|uniref:Glycosyltransferase n=1 Tax=Pelovirga terrestris TaxID=2771352 RepID=A0A8J6QUZ9_9BACT|nr:glycosyltransferase [Pelovirga terrestris]MBD1401015.1 glycosyltransferase [Pelovirga terrestris]